MTPPGSTTTKKKRKQPDCSPKANETYAISLPEGGPGWVRLVNGAEGGDNTARKHNNEEKT